MPLSLEKLTSVEVSFLRSGFNEVEQIKSYADPDVSLHGVVMIITRGPETRAFEERLAEKAGVHTDNKVIYRVTTKDECIFYLKLYDDRMSIALGAGR